MNYIQHDIICTYVACIPTVSYGMYSDKEDDMGGSVPQALYTEKLASLKSLRLEVYSYFTY